MGAYYPQKKIYAERNYKINDADLLAVVESFCNWRHYLKQPCHTVDMVTNHDNLHAFITPHKLTQKQKQLAFDLSAFDFWLVYHKKTLNSSNNLSCQPDYQKNAELENLTTDNTFAL